LPSLEQQLHRAATHTTALEAGVDHEWPEVVIATVGVFECEHEPRGLIVRVDGSHPMTLVEVSLGDRERIFRDEIALTVGNP
jgi:hypothetical protein